MESNEMIEKLKTEISDYEIKYNNLCKEYEETKSSLCTLQSEIRDLKTVNEKQIKIIDNLSVALANEK